MPHAPEAVADGGTMARRAWGRQCLRQLIDGVSRNLLRAAFCEHFGFPEEIADILVILYGRPGEPIPTRDLGRLLNSHRPPTRGALVERVQSIRALMPECLNRAWLDDHYLTPAGIRKCGEALRTASKALGDCASAGTRAMKEAA